MHNRFRTKLKERSGRKSRTKRRNPASQLHSAERLPASSTNQGGSQADRSSGDGLASLPPPFDTLTWKQKLSLWWNDLTDLHSIYGMLITLALVAMIAVGSFCSRYQSPPPARPLIDDNVVIPCDIDSSSDPKYGPWTEPTPIPTHDK